MIKIICSFLWKARRFIQKKFCWIQRCIFETKSWPLNFKLKKFKYIWEFWNMCKHRKQVKLIKKLRICSKKLLTSWSRFFKFILSNDFSQLFRFDNRTIVQIEGNEYFTKFDFISDYCLMKKKIQDFLRIKIWKMMEK
jgi:hypothetical protein